MSDYDEIVNTETGEVVGYALAATDGAVVGIDLEGQIVSVVDPESGQELDASD